MFRHAGYKPYYIKQGDRLWGVYLLGRRVQGNTVLFVFVITQLDYSIGPCRSPNQLYSSRVVHEL